MSRSGYSDDNENPALWRSAVKRATNGYRGQHLLRKLRDALDAMPVKRLIDNEIQNANGEVCALGALDPTATEYEAEALAKHFNIAHALAAEIVFVNDDYHDDTHHWSEGDETPEQRWTRMRTWVEEQIIATDSARDDAPSF